MSKADEIIKQLTRIADALERRTPPKKTSPETSEQWDTKSDEHKLNVLLLKIAIHLPENVTPQFQRIVEAHYKNAWGISSVDQLRAYGSSANLMSQVMKTGSPLKIPHVGKATWEAVAETLKEIGFWDEK